MSITITHANNIPILRVGSACSSALSATTRLILPQSCLKSACSLYFSLNLVSQFYSFFSEVKSCKRAALTHQHPSPLSLSSHSHLCFPHHATCCVFTIWSFLLWSLHCWSCHLIHHCERCWLNESMLLKRELKAMDCQHTVLVYDCHVYWDRMKSF